MGALKIWHKTNHTDNFSRATSWHNPKSLTWLWSLWVEWKTPTSAFGRPKWMMWSCYRTGDGLQWMAKFGKLNLHWHKQKSMFVGAR